jgi:hypothetical protein
MPMRSLQELLGEFSHVVGIYDPLRETEHLEWDCSWVNSLSEEEALALLGWAENPSPLPDWPHARGPACCGFARRWPDDDFELLREEAAMRVGMVAGRLQSEAIRLRLEHLLQTGYEKTALWGLRMSASPASIPILLSEIHEGRHRDLEEDWITCLRRCLKDAGPDLRRDVKHSLRPLLTVERRTVAALGVFLAVADREVVEWIRPLAGNPDKRVRMGVVRILARVHSRDAIELLRQMVHDPRQMEAVTDLAYHLAKNSEYPLSLRDLD